MSLPTGRVGFAGGSRRSLPPIPDEDGRRHPGISRACHATPDQRASPDGVLELKGTIGGVTVSGGLDVGDGD